MIEAIENDTNGLGGYRQGDSQLVMAQTVRWTETRGTTGSVIATQTVRADFHAKVDNVIINSLPC